MAERRVTDVEKQLDALMQPHNSADVIQRMCKGMEQHSLRLQQLYHPEIVAFAFAQHAAAMLAAMKMVGMIRPELADALARDFYETVQVRAQPGTTQLGYPQ